MAKLVWDQTGEKFWETGCDHGVLYPMDTTGKYPKGVAWNGLTSVEESPSGAEATKKYADNIVYSTLYSAEEYAFTINALQSPVEFDACDGAKEVATGVTIGQQSRQAFGFVYRTRIGNDVNDNLGYKLHIVWNCKASPSSNTHDTVNDSPETSELSWEVNTTPVAVTDADPTSTMTIDSTLVSADALAKIEAKLFGDADNEPTLLTPDELIALLKGE